MKLLLSVLLALSAPAFASKKSETQAEARRLREESEKLANKGAWAGVERTYLQLVAMERKGVMIPHDAHVLGAHAAQNRGDPLVTWDRLNRALDAEMKLETLAWRAEIEATYSRFAVTVSPGYTGDVIVTSLEPLFDPVQQQTVTRFAQQLKDERYADALLPLGRYRIDDDLVLESYGGDTQQVTLRSKGAVVADPTITDTTIPVAADTRVAILVNAEIEPSTWTTTGARVQAALTALEGIADVQLISAPDTWYFASFNAEALASVGTSPEAIVAVFRQNFRLTDAQLIVSATQIGVDAAAVPSLEVMGASEILIGGAPIPVDAVARLRQGPRPGAPPAGLDVLLKEGADRVATTEALKSAIGQEEYAALALQLISRVQ